MAANPALVLLGAADAGKSAFAKQVLARVAAARLGEDEPLAGWPGDFVPLLLNVRDLGQVLERLELDDDKCRQRLAGGRVFLVLDGRYMVAEELYHNRDDVGRCSISCTPSVPWSHLKSMTTGAQCSGPATWRCSPTVPKSPGTHSGMAMRRI